MGQKSASYNDNLMKWLQDPENAAEYINAAIEDGDKAVFLLALRQVAQARGGMAEVAEKAHLGRENLYRMLSKRGNPELKSIFNLLHVMGLRLSVSPEVTA